MTACRPTRRALTGAALLSALLAAGNCKSAGGKGAVAPLSTSPTAAASPAGSMPGAPTLLEARQAQRQGRLGEALRLLDAIAESRRADAPTRLEALSHGAFLRMTADDPAQRDLARAQVMLSEVARLDAEYATPLPAALLLTVAEELQALRARNETLDAAMRLQAAQERQGQHAAQQQDQKSAALRNENRQLRDEIKALQAELARKDDAIRRMADKLLNTPPGVYD